MLFLLWRTVLACFCVMMLASGRQCVPIRYVAGVRADAERMERSLRQLTSLLDEWSGAQRSWLWLDCIFAGMLRLACWAPGTRLIHGEPWT